MGHEGTRPATTAHPDLGVEGLIDVDPIVLAVGQGVRAPLPDEAGRRVGVDSTAQKHRLLLVEVASNVAHRLVHCQHRLVQVCKGTAPGELGLGDPKVGNWAPGSPQGKLSHPQGCFQRAGALPASLTNLSTSQLSLPRHLHGGCLSSPPTPIMGRRKQLQTGNRETLVSYSLVAWPA